MREKNTVSVSVFLGSWICMASSFPQRPVISGYAKYAEYARFFYRKDVICFL